MTPQAHRRINRPGCDWGRHLIGRAFGRTRSRQSASGFGSLRPLEPRRTVTVHASGGWECGRARHGRRVLECLRHSINYDRYAAATDLDRYSSSTPQFNHVDKAVNLLVALHCRNRKHHATAISFPIVGLDRGWLREGRLVCTARPLRVVGRTREEANFRQSSPESDDSPHRP